MCSPSALACQSGYPARNRHGWSAAAARHRSPRSARTTARRCPALPQIIGWSSRPPTVDWSIPPVRMVEPLRQPSWSSACGFVDGGRTAHRTAFRPPAAHNSTGSTTTTIKLSINELHPLKFQKRHLFSRILHFLHFLHFLHTSFFVRLGIPFLRPDPHVLEAGARRGCQGRPSLWPGGTLSGLQAAP